MPHLVLEYSSNLIEKGDFPVLFRRLHQILETVSSAALESCKSRAVERDDYFIGNGEPENAFVHLEVRLAEGRPMRVREEVGRQMLEALAEHFSGSLEVLKLQITVESREFLRNLYFKIPENSV